MEQLENIKPHQLVPGINARLVHGAQSTVSFVDIVKGTKMPAHKHPHEQVTYIVEGNLEMEIGDEFYSLQPGAVHVIPPDTLHSAHALTDCKVIDFFSPSRDDYRF